MKNIGIVTTWFERGAAYVSRQYEEILAKENNVFIYARGGEEYSKEKEWNHPNVTYSTRKKNQIEMYIDKKELKKWIDNNKIDIVFFNEQQFWLPVIWCKEWDIIVGSYVDYYTETTVPYFEVYDFLICNTKRHQSVFETFNNSYYVPWGTDTDIFKPDEKREKDKKKLVFFNSCGYNPKRKGVHHLINAFYDLKDDSDARDIKLLVHTQKKLDLFFPDLKEKIKILTDAGILEEISETITAPGIYHYGDVYCYLSILDGIGLSLPEAISCGLPTIVPDNAPMNEFVVDGFNGKVVKIDRLYSRADGYYWPQCNVDIDDVKRSVKFYIDNKSEISTMKLNSRKYAIEYLSWKDRQSEINSIFKNIEKKKVNKQLIDKIKKAEAKKIVRNFKNIMTPDIYINSFKIIIDR